MKPHRNCRLLGRRAIPAIRMLHWSWESIYEKAGKNAEAEQQFRIAVQKMPRSAEAHYALGSAADGGEEVSQSRSGNC